MVGGHLVNEHPGEHADDCEVCRAWMDQRADERALPPTERLRRSIERDRATRAESATAGVREDSDDDTGD